MLFLFLPALLCWESLTRRLAETLATEDALAALPQLAVNLGTDPQVVDRLRLEFEQHLHVLHANGEADDESAQRFDQQYTAQRLALLNRKRATVVMLRDERCIDDIVLRQIQNRLDIEEIRLNRREAAE
jgi:CPA1 family monovalent cation:H+ antiporter